MNKSLRNIIISSCAIAAITAGPFLVLAAEGGSRGGGDHGDNSNNRAPQVQQTQITPVTSHSQTEDVAPVLPSSSDTSVISPSNPSNDSEGSHSGNDNGSGGIATTTHNGNGGGDVENNNGGGNGGHENENEIGDNENGGSHGTTTPATIPVISGVSVTGITNSAVTVIWNTNQSSDSKVYYSTSSPVIGGSSTLSANSAVMGLSHSLNLTGLSASTTYIFAVQSTDSAGTATSSEFSFTTLANPVVASTSPTISNAFATVSSGSVSFSWNTADAANAQVYYSTSSPVLIGASSTLSVINAIMGTAHTVIVNGLSPSTVYHFIIRSTDAASVSQATGEFALTTAPMI
jgi:hypothetical protein